MRMALIVCWLIVSVSQLYLGLQDSLRWASDADFVRVGLDWTDSTIPHGVVAFLISIGLVVQNRVGSWMATGCTVLFGLYYVAYLVFGGEGAVYLRILVPVLLIGLVVATLRILWRLLCASARKGV